MNVQCNERSTYGVDCDRTMRNNNDGVGGDCVADVDEDELH